jgi:hypothetical protein
MVLMSDTVTDARETYAAYKNRYRVERNFEVFKSTCKCQYHLVKKRASQKCLIFVVVEYISTFESI